MLEAMALSISERVSLAQALWQSIDAVLEATKEREALAEAIRRGEELSSGVVQSGNKCAPPSWAWGPNPLH
jgi:putative addiction module component (TIGR02574 family)